MTTRWTSFCLLLGSLMGCASTQPAAVVMAPSVAGSHVEVEAQPPPEPVTPPMIETCLEDVDVTCAADIVFAAAMSHLGKTTAEFDGENMVEIEHDPELVLEEALADPLFCAMLDNADALPRDGALSPLEAHRVEAAVLARLESL